MKNLFTFAFVSALFYLSTSFQTIDYLPYDASGLSESIQNDIQSDYSTFTLSNPIGKTDTVMIITMEGKYRCVLEDTDIMRQNLGCL